MRFVKLQKRLKNIARSPLLSVLIGAGRAFPRVSSHLARLIQGGFMETLSVIYKFATTLSIIDYL